MEEWGAFTKPPQFNSTDKMKMMRVKVRCNTERAGQAFIVVEVRFCSCLSLVN